MTLSLTAGGVRTYVSGSSNALLPLVVSYRASSAYTLNNDEIIPNPPTADANIFIIALATCQAENVDKQLPAKLADNLGEYSGIGIIIRTGIVSDQSSW